MNLMVRHGGGPAGNDDDEDWHWVPVPDAKFFKGSLIGLLIVMPFWLWLAWVCWG